MRRIIWNKNGDHPDDHVGELTVDFGKLAELKPELLGRDKPVTKDEIPPEAYYPRIEGAYVRFFRRPDEEYAGDKIHEECGRTWHDHGWIDDGSVGPDGLAEGAIVCPGMFFELDDDDALAEQD